MRVNRMVILWILGTPAVLTGQQPESGTRLEALRALEECDAAANTGDADAAGKAAQAAEAAARKVGVPGEADALTVRAQVLTRCRIPFAGLLRQGALVEEANELLEAALVADPAHLDARFNLGLNHYHTPAFLGRRADAIVAFEHVIAHHGRVDDPRVATSYDLLGELYAAAGRRGEAAAVWREGAERFPEHEGLRGRVNLLPPLAPATTTPPTGRSDAPVTEDASPHRMDPIVVEAGGYSMDDPRTATRISRLEVYTLPGGTADVLHTFRTLPGVTQVTEGADLYVRGGDPAEAPIYLEGARLLHAGRFETLHGSLFGVLDPASLRSAYFSSGGFSARYGNALSGIVDLRMEGRPQARYGRAGVNLTSFGATVHQPLGGRAGAWVTGMLTHTGPLLTLHRRADDYPESPAAAQATGALVWEPQRGVSVKLSGLVESDGAVARVRALSYEGRFTSHAASQLGVLSVRLTNAAGTADLHFSAGASSRRHTLEFGVLDRTAEDRGLTMRLDGSLDESRLQLRAGLEAASFDARRDGRVPTAEEVAPGSPATEPGEARREARHIGAYGEIEGRLTDRLALVGGIRADLLPGEAVATLDPRLAVAYRLDRWTVRFGGGLFSQGRWRHRPDIPNAGTPNGIPLRARHLVAGAQSEGPVAVRVEGYIKDYDDYEPDPADTGPQVVDGRARGLDVLLRWAGTDRLAGWLTYSLLDASLELADGTNVSSSHDVTHTLALIGTVALNDAWELGLTARYASGRPYTPVVGSAPAAPERPLAPRYGPPLSARLPDYRRIDARLTRSARLFCQPIIAYLEALNVFARANVVGYTYDAGYRNARPVRTFFSSRTLVVGAELAF